MAKPRKRVGRLFKRPERPHWYADLRDLGAGRPSTKTADEDEATKWVVKALLALEGPQNGRHGSPRTLLADFAEHHLAAKRLNRRDSTVDRDELSLRTFIARVGSVTLEDVDSSMLNNYARRRQVEGRATQTILHELHALSSLYKRAISEGYLVVNPVALMVDKPRIERDEVEWLEPEEAAAFLAECEGDVHTLMAIALLTGARKQEVTGLEWSDVDFERGLVRIRANKWRELKRGHARSVKLWPQLREILEGLDRKGRLVVPNPNGTPYTDKRSGMKKAEERAKVGKHVSWNTLRHTYASLRLQTLDNGAAISPFRVAKELGHQGLDMIFKHYGHILESPQRLEVIEYRLSLE